MRDWLLAIRNNRCMSQKDVADMSGISQPSYCNIENGRRNPDVSTAKAIANVLGFAWTDFFDGDGEFDKSGFSEAKQTSA